MVIVWTVGFFWFFLSPACVALFCAELCTGWAYTYILYATHWGIQTKLTWCLKPAHSPASHRMAKRKKSCTAIERPKKSSRQTGKHMYDRIYKIACAKCVCSLLNNKRNALIYVYTQAHIASIHQARARKNQRTNNSTRNFSNTHQSSYQSYIDQRWRHDQGRSVYLLRRSRRQTSY